MSNNNTEEKSPLLFVLDGNEDLTKADKAYFDSNRFRGIAHGATTVFTHFPNFIGTFWIVTALFGLIFFMIILLLLSTIATAGLRTPRCVAATDIASETVHLVHSHNPWNPKETKLMEEIFKRYPKYKIHLITIRDEKNTVLERKTTRGASTGTTSTSMASTVTRNEELPTLIRKKRRIDEARYNPFNINVEAKRLFDMLLHGKIDDKYETRKARATPEEASSTTTIPTTTAAKPTVKTIEDLTQLHPDMNIENLTYTQAFTFTPLHYYWPHLNEKLRLFAVRVLQLWQSGGISFDMQLPIEKMERLAGNATKGEKVKSFVISEKLDYEKLPVGVVKVDEDGLHMESKVPCHVFFGEIMMNLRKASGHSTVREVMRKSIKVFCKHFSASKKYCDAFNNK